MENIKPQRFDHGRPMLVAGIRRHHNYIHAQHSIPEQWAAFNQQPNLPAQIGTTTYGVVCGHDENGIEYLCGAEVSALNDLPADIGRIRIEPQLYAVFLHSEHINQISNTWQRILHQWLPNAEYQSAHKPDFEIYTQQYNPQTGMGNVEIWISVVNKP